MAQSPEDLGLAPDLSDLPSEVRGLILHGGRDVHYEQSEAAVAACVEMLRADYGVSEVWMTITDPANGISKEFFSKNGEQAEAYLERVISETYELVDRRERQKSYSAYHA